MRICVGGFLHESNSFAPEPAEYSDFVAPAGLPGLAIGQAVFDAVRGTSTSLSGAIEQGSQLELTPLLWAIANPSGPVSADAFERVSSSLCAELTRALAKSPIDGIYLDLHGAGMTPTFGDMEGELLRQVRVICGEIPIAISVDPHANLTEAMVSQVDIIAPYRTYPHVDMRESGARALELLLKRIARGAPWCRSFRQLDYWIPLVSQCTLLKPMSEIMNKRSILASKPGIVELGLCFGFPYSDFHDCGPSVFAFSEHENEGESATRELLIELKLAEPQFDVDARNAEAAVAYALSRVSEGVRPIVIADTQDNPGGGGHGDTTGLLQELDRQRAAGSILAVLNDAESASRCANTALGQSVQLELGGKSDGVPFITKAKILMHSDGNFVLTGPMAKGNPAGLGPSALVETAGGVRVIISSRKIQAYDQALLYHFGINPQDCPIIALKSSVHFRADFNSVAAETIIALAPGPVVADSASLPFIKVRPNVARRPRTNGQA